MNENYFSNLSDLFLLELTKNGLHKRFRKKIETLKDISLECEQNFAYWKNFWKLYQDLTTKKAGLLNRLAQTANSFESIGDFWECVSDTNSGKTERTYWDTYENGKRRYLEGILADCYGSDDALLVNCGMSTVAVALGSLDLRKRLVLTGDRNYFETSDYFESFLEKEGIKVVRVPIETREFQEKVFSDKPKVVFLETVTNTPDVKVFNGLNMLNNNTPDTNFVIDNTTQSHLTRWFDFCTVTDKLLVVESATKYLTSNCMAGVIYGENHLMKKVRHYARATGQQLQEKAFNYMNESDLFLASERLTIHSRNVEIFQKEIKRFGSFEFCRSLDSNSSERSTIFNNGRGCLLFLKLNEKDKSHNVLVDSWVSLLKRKGYSLSVRAGFGWPETTVRAYESDILNQPDSPVYVRISVGTEPDFAIRDYATALGEIAARI